jgi:hypothetical protein
MLRRSPEPGEHVRDREWSEARCERLQPRGKAEDDPAAGEQRLTREATGQATERQLDAAGRDTPDRREKRHLPRPDGPLVDDREVDQRIQGRLAMDQSVLQREQPERQ